MSFIEATVDNVNDFIIHSFLDIEINRKVFKTTCERVRRLWAHKIIMIINEINMINATLLTKIDSNCVIFKVQKRDINNFFDNILIVILMKDFFQLISMKEKSLWQQYKNFTKEQNRDLLLWRKFDNVIILNEQMK
jgi:Fe-S cluster biosynthesis and repair protein YggX